MLSDCGTYMNAFCPGKSFAIFYLAIYVLFLPF
jgi:hypothetical protein